jgi:acyl-CoA reductase-like NAD-dependent aldehyde dehydrogenase
MTEIEQYGLELANNARNASQTVRVLPIETRNSVLLSVAEKLRNEVPSILKANKNDVEHSKGVISDAMIDRLTLNPARIESMARGVEEIAAFADPLNKVLEKNTLTNGIQLSRVSVPIGSVFFIYESRPNVTIDGASLCFKSGNAVILRGGKESLETSTKLANIFRSALEENHVNPNAVQLVNTPDRSLMSFLLQQNQSIDLVIPRGGENLIKAVVEQSRIPVIKHFNGICHIFVDKSANFSKTAAILYPASFDSKAMQEEIFGPILPVLTYSTEDEMIQTLQKKSKPLALYLFTNDSQTEKRVFEQLNFGGGCVNDTLVHLANHHLPFGGVGESGMGSYHGEDSFKAFSHSRSILKTSTLIDLPLRYRPYTSQKKSWLKRFLK